jgi:uncharacterized protein YkwD
MVQKSARYAGLSLASFVFFSAIFQTVAYAQTPTRPYLQELPKLSKQTITQVEPTPITSGPTLTVLASPAMISTTTQAEEIKTATPPPAPAQKNTQPTNTPSPTPTNILPTQTPTPTIKPTTIPTATPTPSPIKLAPTSTVTPPVTTGGGLDAEKLFSLANAHRQTLGLPAFQKDERTCSLAAARSTEIAAEMAAGTLHSGMYGRNLPYWNTENAIALPTEEAAFNWWLNDSIHRQALEGNKIYSCTACSGKYCVQEFTSYQPK